MLISSKAEGDAIMKLFVNTILAAALTLPVWAAHGQSVSDYEKRAISNARAKKAPPKKTVQSYESGARTAAASKHANDEKWRNFFKARLGNFLVDCGSSAYITNGELWEVKSVGTNAKAIDMLYDLLEPSIKIINPTIEQKLNYPNAHRLMIVKYKINMNYKGRKYKDTLFYRTLGSQERSQLSYQGDRQWRRFVDADAREMEIPGLELTSERYVLQMGALRFGWVDNSYHLEGVFAPDLENEISVGGPNDGNLRENVIKNQLNTEGATPIADDFCENPEKADQQILRHIGSKLKIGAFIIKKPESHTLMPSAQYGDCDDERSLGIDWDVHNLYREVYMLPIKFVYPGSVAARYGLRVDDMIVAINGAAVSEETDFTKFVNDMPSKSSLKLSVVRYCRGGSSDWTGRTVNMILGDN